METKPPAMSQQSHRMRKPSSRPQIALIGGGIGGLILAIGLHKAGVNFHIYEAAPRFSEIGAGVGLAPNAQRAMSLIDPRIREMYDRLTTLNDLEENRRYFFEFRMGMTGRPGTRTAGVEAGQLISQPGGPGKGMSMIHRARFLEGLMEMLPRDCATFGKRLERVEQTASRPRMFFADGSEAEADAIVGCDGVKSAVRSSVFGKAAGARFSGKYAYRGLVPMADAIAVVGETRARNSQGYIGYGGHVLTMAVDGGKTMNVVAFRTKDDGEWEHEAWVLPMRQKDIEHDFAEWSADVRGILGLLQQSDKWALFEHPPLPSLCAGSVCLMGDAAHATTPHQGSGAAMAIEDAYILGKLLGSLETVRELPAAFEAYDAARVERSMRVISTSRQCGDVYELQDGMIGDDLDLVDENLKGRYDWIWDENIEELWLEAERVFMRARPTTSQL